tara:strand:+ start:772 stop:1020 length:249 start_codon:yes stop_codon:yes gene_type:complete
MTFCPFRKYKDLFGKPNTWVHKYRLFDSPIIDNLMTIIGAILFSYMSGISIELSIFLWYGLGILLHKLFCVKTRTNKLLNLA